MLYRQVHNARLLRGFLGFTITSSKMLITMLDYVTYGMFSLVTSSLLFLSGLSCGLTSSCVLIRLTVTGFVFSYSYGRMA